MSFDPNLDVRIRAAEGMLAKAKSANNRGRDGAASSYAGTAYYLLQPESLRAHLPVTARAHPDHQREEELSKYQA